MNQISSLIKKYLNNPLLSWGTLPFSLLLFGTILGARQTELQLIPAFLLYAFLLLTSLLERILIKKVKRALKYPVILNHIYWIVLVIVLILIWTTVNWLSFGLLMLYLLFIFVAYHPVLRMEQSVFYVVLQLFFKVIIISFLAYYVQTRFLEFDLLVYFLPTILIFLPLIIYWQRTMFIEEDSRYQYFIELYYLPLMIVSYALGVLTIIVLLFSQGATLLQTALYALPLLILFILLAVKKFRLAMRMDNYLNLVILLTMVLYAVTFQYPL